MKRIAILLGFTSILACSVGEGATMLAGDNCQSCHAGDQASALGAHVWTVAGTVYGAPDADENAGKKDVLVHLTDSRNVKLTLRTNVAGNFYTAESLTFPLQACVEAGGLTHCMQTATRGSCNECHTVPSQNQAPGRVAAP